MEPIIIFGTERSGTTLLYSLLANHDKLYWLSRLDSILVNHPYLTTYFRKYYEKIINENYVAKKGLISRSTGIISPSECMPYWRKIFKWGNENNYMIEDDCFDENYLSPRIGNNILKDIDIRLKISNKERPLFKQPGFSLKIKFFNKLFPNAIFIHIERNPYDNLRSLVEAKIKSKEKFWGTKVPGWKYFINENYVIQSLYQMKKMNEIISQDILMVEDYEKRYLKIKYEELTNKPKDVIIRVLNFCRLTIDQNIFKMSDQIRPTIMRKELPFSISQQNELELYDLYNKYVI